jgi:hypothetical protein
MSAAAADPFVVGRSYKLRLSRSYNSGKLLGAYIEKIRRHEEVGGGMSTDVDVYRFANGEVRQPSSVIPVDQEDYLIIPCKKRHELLCEDGSAGCFLDVDAKGRWPPIAKGGNRRKSRQNKRRSKKWSTRNRRY